MNLYQLTQLSTLLRCTMHLLLNIKYLSGAIMLLHYNWCVTTLHDILHNIVVSIAATVIHWSPHILEWNSENLCIPYTRNAHSPF